MYWKCPKNCVLAILRVKTEIFIFLNHTRHLLVPKHAFWRIARLKRSTGLTRAILWCLRPSWIFNFLIFENSALLGFRLKLCMSNFVMIGHTVKTLLACLFFIGNVLKVPPKLCFGDLKGENWNIYLSEPHKAPPCAKTRILTYRSPKSAYLFDPVSYTHLTLPTIYSV